MARTTTRNLTIVQKTIITMTTIPKLKSVRASFQKTITVRTTTLSLTVAIVRSQKTITLRTTTRNLIGVRFREIIILKLNFIIIKISSYMTEIYKISITYILDSYKVEVIEYIRSIIFILFQILNIRKQILSRDQPKILNFSFLSKILFTISLKQIQINREVFRSYFSIFTTIIDT